MCEAQPRAKTFITMNLLSTELVETSLCTEDVWFFFFLLRGGCVCTQATLNMLKPVSSILSPNIHIQNLQTDLHTFPLT